MFEFRVTPPASDIMRRQAALSQFQALAACMGIAARTSRAVTAGGLTALQLLGVPIPTRTTLDPAVVDCVTFSHKTRLRVNGAVCHTWPNIATPGAVIDVDGVECLSPEAAFAYMGKHLQLLELVKLADSLTRRDEVLKRTTIHRIWTFIQTCDPFPGQAKCEKALCLARERTDSPKETETRLIIARECFPPLTVNYELETPDGTRLLDLASADFRIAVEYDGGHHASRISEDHERLNDIQSHLWTVFVVDNDTLRSDIRRRKFLNALERAFVNAGAVFTRRHLSLDELADRRRHQGWLTQLHDIKTEG